MNIVRVPHICGSILLGSMGSAKLKFNRDFQALFDVVSKRVGRDRLYDAWCAELYKLDGKLRSLAKTPAVTPKGFRMKAAVILAAERAFEEDAEEFWRLEDLRDSLMADLA